MGLTLSLPRSAAVTDELLAPPPALSADDLHDLRQRMHLGLAPLADELKAPERLVLDAFRFRTALRSPESCKPEGHPFVASPLTCRRAVGLAAVELCLRRRVVGPAHAVAQVLDSGIEDIANAEHFPTVRLPWWARWFAGLGPGAHAAVAAEATTWATQVWTSLSWDGLPTPVVVGGHDDWWQLPGSRLSLRGRADVRIKVDGRTVLVVMGSGAPEPASRAELLFSALVCTLVGGARSAPGRVLGLWPAAGQVRAVPIGARALEVAAEETIGAVATWVDAIIEARSGRT